MMWIGYRTSGGGKGRLDDNAATTVSNVSDKQSPDAAGKSEQLSELLRPHGLDRLDARGDLRF